MEAKEERTHPFFRKTDWIAVALILLFSLGFWGFWMFFHKTEQQQIEIYSDNQLIRTIPLPSEDEMILIPDKKVSLELKNNEIRFSETDCPDKTCQKAGFISQSGEATICLPNRIVVKIAGAQKSPAQPDGIAG